MRRPWCLRASHLAVAASCPGLFVAWASVLTATEDWAVTLHIIAVLAFFVGRVLHTVCFVAQKQPMRSLTYTTAVVAVVVMGVNGVIGSARWL